MIKLKDVFEEWRDRIEHPIIAIETGCSFLWGEEFDPYISTPNIVQHLVAPTQGHLYSLEIDRERIDTCREHLKDLGLETYVDFLCGDSVEMIKTLPPDHVNFVWLDSSEDAEHAVCEYNAVQPALTDKHIICVDDYGSPNSVKWQDISKIIMTEFSDCATYETPTGLIVGYNE
jgi:hypothetical protein